jgi:hypothetical protein
MTVLLLSGGLVVLAIIRQEQQKQLRAVGLLVLFMSLGAFAILIGWGRGGTIAVDDVWPARYVLLAVPAFCTAYYAWELYGPKQWRTTVHMSFFIAVCLLLVPNTKRGLVWRDWYVDGVQKISRDLEAGVPHDALAQRHRSFLMRWAEPQRLAEYMQMLHKAGMGPFSKMRGNAGEMKK